MAKDIYISQISDHFTKTIETTFFIRGINEKETLENKKKYLEIIFQDATGTLSGIIWDENIKEMYLTFSNQVVKVKALVIQNSNAAFQLIISSMQLESNYNQLDYVNGISQEDTKKYMDLLLKYISLVKSDNYRQLLKFVFESVPEFPLLPATVREHHNYNGGLLVHTISVTCLTHYIARTLSAYNTHPSYVLPYNNDLIITSSLLHCIGTVRMVRPFPEMQRIDMSIPLTLYELTIQYLQQAISLSDAALTQEEQSLLYHMIGCVYESEKRKPMLREALILRDAVQLQTSISRLEYFIESNKDKNGIHFDKKLNNYIYIRNEEVPHE